MAGINNNNFLGANFLRTGGETKIRKPQENLPEIETNVTKEASGAQANTLEPTEQSQAALEDYNNYLGMLGQVEVNVPSQSGTAADAAEGAGRETVTTTTDSDGGSTTTTNIYDEAGRLVRSTVEKKDKDGNVTESKLISYKYKNDDKTPYQIQTDTFDANGKLQMQGFEHFRADGTKYAANSVKYDGSGHKTEELYLQFDESERVTEEKDIKFDSKGNVVWRRHAVYDYGRKSNDSSWKTETSYEYDSDGNVTKETEHRSDARGEKDIVTTYERVTIKDENGDVTGSKLISNKSVNGKRYQQQTDTFDANGKLQTQAFEHYRADGTKYADNVAKFDENGNKTEELYRQFDESGNLTETVEVKFDKDGNVINRTRTTYKDGGNEVEELSTTEYEYDANGKLKGAIETITDSDGNVTKKITTRIELMRSGERVSELVKDKDGKLTEENTYNYSGNLIKDFHHIEYDENEQKIKDITTKYEYDENGRVTRSEEIEKDADENVISRKIIKYKYSDEATKDDIPSVADAEIRNGKDEPVSGTTTNYRADGTVESISERKYENGILKEETTTLYNEKGVATKEETTEYNDKGEKTKITTVTYKFSHDKRIGKTIEINDLINGTVTKEEQVWIQDSTVRPGRWEGVTNGGTLEISAEPSLYRFIPITQELSITQKPVNISRFVVD